MKSHPFLSLTLLPLLAPFATAALAPGVPAWDYFIPGDAAQEAVRSAEARGHLLPAMQDYLYYLRHEDSDALRRYGMSSAAKTARHIAFDIARRFHREVNDLQQRRDGSWATPLSLAVQAQDAELVELLLRLGAHPFGPNAAVPLSELPPLPNVLPDARVGELLRGAMAKVNPLQLLRENEAARRKAREAAAPALQAPQRQVTRVRDLVPELPEADMNAYLCEPGAGRELPLRRAFGMLSGTRTVLQVQPLTRSTLPPERCNGHGLYSQSTTTGRVVRALKGEAPAQELITWSEGHEARLEETTEQLAADAEPIFLFISAEELARGRVSGNTLDLGGVDSYDTWQGRQWLSAFNRVLADFPELRNTTPATPAELAAAAKVMQQAEVLVRAEIFRYSVKLDEEAGTATVDYTASLRDPLKGGVIKGILRDWGNLRYRRSFPLTDEWRRIHAECEAGLRGGHSHPHVPVILALAEAPEGESGSNWANPQNRRSHMKVQQAFDAMSDAAMLHALNAAALHPSAAIEP